MKTFFAFTTGLLGGYVMTVAFVSEKAYNNGKFKEFVDMLVPND